jgi:rifampicin phosphotransferase
MAGLRWIKDHPFREKWPFLTRANVGEVIPEPPSPAGWELVWDLGGCMKGWRDCATNRFGIGDDEFIDDPNLVDWITLQGGYGYLNASWIRVAGERMPGMSAAAIDQAYFGDHPDVPEYVQEPWHINPASTEVMGKWLGWVMGTMEQTEIDADRAEARAIRAARPDFSSMSEPALLEYALSFRPVCRRMFDQHINYAFAAAIGPGTIAAICGAIGKPEAAMKLLTGFGGVDSAEPSYEMWKMSRTARRSPALTALFEGGYRGLDARLRASSEPDARAFCTAFDRFIAEFGSRGPNEWDILADTWETNPELPLAAIDRMRLAPDSASPMASNANRETERLAVTAEILALLKGDPETAGTFSAAAASAQIFVPGRERTKTNIIRVIEEQRMAVRELGRRAVARGDADSVTDVCFLFEDELHELAAGQLGDIRPLTGPRREYHQWLLTLEPPFIFNGRPTPNTTWPKRADHQATVALVGETLAGVPGCPGTARGRARVVLDPADPEVLEPGDILIAPMTDPAWTPLFVPAAGVVVNVGAALSHAIIVSRELGIPCVVSVTGATQRIPDGALIEVNGDAGTVTVLELP